jgi:dephospho-CoA kinase
MKIIITGPQCSGKTTLAKSLEKRNLHIPIIDEDDEILKRNGGKSPGNWTQWDYKWTVLRPEIQQDIVDMEKVIFFTSFFDPLLLMTAKQNGFKILQLVATEEVLGIRNRERMATGVDDAAYGWQINMPYHKELWEKKLVDMRIDTDRSVEELAQLILRIIETRQELPLLEENINPVKRVLPYFAKDT